MIWHASRWLILVYQKTSLSRQQCTQCQVRPTTSLQRFSFKSTIWKSTSGAWVLCSISCCLERFLSLVVLSQRSFKMLSKASSTSTIRHSRPWVKSARTSSSSALSRTTRHVLLPKIALLITGSSLSPSRPCRLELSETVESNPQLSKESMRFSPSRKSRTQLSSTWVKRLLQTTLKVSRKCWLSKIQLKMASCQMTPSSSVSHRHRWRLQTERFKNW